MQHEKRILVPELEGLMLASAFGCREHPFGAGFDSRYYFVRPGQEESFRELISGISDRKGSVLVTGRTGTGKTTLLCELILELQAANSLTIFFPTPVPTSDALLDACLEHIGLRHELGAERSRKLRALAASLRRSDPERATVLLADEGHALTDDVLSTLLKLAAPDAKGRSTLSVVIAGEPMLEGRLSEDLFLPLASPIGYHHRLTPLDKEEIASFIRHRLRAAGCAKTNPFSPEAVERIAYYSEGLPARINRLGDIALFIATLESKEQITPDVVEQAACDALLAEEPLDPSRFAPSGEPPALSFEVFSERPELPALTDVVQTPGQLAAMLDLTLDAAGAEATPGAASDAPTPYDAAHDPLATPIGSGITAPHGKTRRLRWVRYTVAAVGLGMIVITAGWLWSSYQPRFHELQPLVAKLHGAVQLTGERNQAAIADPGSAADPRIGPVPVTGRDKTRGSWHQQPAPASQETVQLERPPMAVADLGPPLTASPASPMAEMKRPPELAIARPGPTPPDTSTAQEPASWSENFQLLTPARLRERPAVYSRLLEILKPDTHVLVTGRVPGSHWYRVRAHGGQEGFVYGGLVPKPPTNGAAEYTSSSPTLGLLQLDEADAATAEIAQLLALASEHVRADRLMAPRFDNALAVYRKILGADPQNQEALAGIETIKAKLMGFARDAAARGDMQTARSQIDKVLFIDAEDRAARAALATFRGTVPLTDFAGLEEPAPAR